MSGGGELRSHRDLDAWRRGLEWVEHVYRATRSWPDDERLGLTGQVRRAAVSVPAALAEGAGRRSTGEFLQCVGVARGALAQAETLLILARRLGYLPDDDVDLCFSGVADLDRMLTALSRSLQARRRSPRPA